MHEELLKNIERKMAYCDGMEEECRECKYKNELPKAILAILKLHKPVSVMSGDGTSVIYYNKSKLQCELCHGKYTSDIGIYPCPTIQAIERELQ